MGNLRITELYYSESEQIRSDSPSSSEAEYQVDVFTFPPNRNNPDGRRQISVVSLDSESFSGEDDQQWAERLHRNALRADHQANKEVICQGEEDLKNADCFNPRVGRRRPSPPLGTLNMSSSWITTAMKSSPCHLQTWLPYSRYSRVFLKPLRLQKPRLHIAAT